MMPTIPGIFATTALCLTALGLSSCYTNIHQHVWQKAKVAKGGEWLDNQNNIELLSDGKHIYAKGNQGNMRGCCKGAVVVSPCAGVYAIYESCTQNAPDAETTPESTTPSQSAPST